MDEAEWAINEFGAAMLGGRRRTDRLIEVASVPGQRPGASLPAACADPAMRKGAYRLPENAAIAPAAILASHIQATWERAAAVPVVLAAQDTTEVDFTGLSWPKSRSVHASGLRPPARWYQRIPTRRSGGRKRRQRGESTSRPRQVPLQVQRDQFRARLAELRAMIEAA